jgi:hypothetical protein
MHVGALMGSLVKIMVPTLILLGLSLGLVELLASLNERARRRQLHQWLALRSGVEE